MGRNERIPVVKLYTDCRTCLKDSVYFCLLAIIIMFCATQDIPVSNGWFLLIKDDVEKAELSKDSWYPKRKLVVTLHFSEVIKQLGKDPIHSLYFTTFNNVA